MFLDLIKTSQDILDIGCGPHLAFWYSSVPRNTKLTAIDLFFSPAMKRRDFSLYKMDALDLDKCKKTLKVIELKNGKEFSRKVDWKKKFDLVVASHIFEHVNAPKRLARGISIIAQKSAFVYIAIPDPNNFTEKFYHLIHPEGGGHVVKIRKQEMIKLMKKNGFLLVKYQDLPDDWLWLKKLYNWKRRGIKYFSQKDLDYIANTFVKELTPEKGYFYGGEYIFKKK